MLKTPVTADKPLEEKRIETAKLLKMFVLPSSEGYVEFLVDKFNIRFKLKQGNALTTAMERRASVNMSMGTMATSATIKATQSTLICKCADAACKKTLPHKEMHACPKCAFVRYCSSRCMQDDADVHRNVCIGTVDFGLRQNIVNLRNEFIRWCACFGKLEKNRVVLGPVLDPELGRCIRWSVPMPFIRRIESAEAKVEMQTELDTVATLIKLAGDNAPTTENMASSGDAFLFDSSLKLNSDLALTIIHHWGRSCSAGERGHFLTPDHKNLACMVCGSALQVPATILKSPHELEKDIEAFGKSDYEASIAALVDGVTSLSVKLGGSITHLNSMGTLSGSLFCVCSSRCAKLHEAVIMPHINFTIIPHPSTSMMAIKCTSVCGLGYFDFH